MTDFLAGGVSPDASHQLDQRHHTVIASLPALTARLALTALAAALLAVSVAGAATSSDALVSAGPDVVERMTAGFVPGGSPLANLPVPNPTCQLEVSWTCKSGEHGWGER